ncbi:MAG TPA: right-handed parallel beta-helix repeat-containing protein [Tepidisphaeraceae bacterium]|nr:right-handed parallel beta-helix repeat-containing protein [Tepidisphaeraceae bacterium]
MPKKKLLARVNRLESRILLSSTLQAIYVDGTHGNDPGSGDISLGTSPTDAFKTIQEAATQAVAIDAMATANDAPPPAIVIYIEQGTYREMVSLNGAADVTIMPYQDEPVVVSGFDPVAFNATADAGTDVWSSQPLFPTNYSATTDQLVLGLSATTATDQVFQDGQMIPASRYPQNPTPALGETHTPTYAKQKHVTLLQSPQASAMPTPAAFAQTGTSNSAYFQASFDDPNLLNFAGSAAQRKNLSPQAVIGELQSFLTGATIHINSDYWGWETGTITGVAMDDPMAIVNGNAAGPIAIVKTALARHVATMTLAPGTPADGYDVGDSVAITGINPTFNGTHVITAATAATFSYALAAPNKPATAVAPTPRITYTLPSSTSMTGAPPAGCFYYLSNFAGNNVASPTVAQALAFGNAPSQLATASGAKTSADSAAGYVIDNNPLSTTYQPPAAGQAPLYMHILSASAPTGVEVKTRDVAFDLSDSQRVTVEGITLMAATVATDASSTDDTIANVKAYYLSAYDRTTIDASTRRAAALPNYQESVNANLASGMTAAAAQSAAAASAAATAQSLQANETSAIDVWVQFVSGIELMGEGDELIGSTVAYCAGNGVTIGNIGATVSGCTIHDVDTMGTDNAAVITLPSGYSIQSSVISQGTADASLPPNYTMASVTITPANANNDFAVHDWVYIEGLSYISSTIDLDNNFGGCGTYQITAVNPDHSFTYQYPVPTNDLAQTLDGQTSRASTGIDNGYVGHVIGKYPGSISTDPIQIVGNTIYNAGRSDIVYRGAVNLTIDYNDLSNGGLVSVDCGGTYSWGEDASQNIDGVDADGNPVPGNANSQITLEYNTVHDMNCLNGTGIYLDTNSSGTTVEHNIFYNVQFGIIFSPPSVDPVIKYNTFSPSSHFGVAQSLTSQNVEESANGLNIGQGNHIDPVVQDNLFGAANAPDGPSPDANALYDVTDLTNDTTNYIPKGYKLARVTTNPAKQNFNLKAKVSNAQQALNLTQSPGLYPSYGPGSQLSGVGAIPFGAPWMAPGVSLTTTPETGGSITLNWTAPLATATSRADPIEYEVYRYALGSSPASYNTQTPIATVSATTWTDTLPAADPLNPPPIYIYFVRALNRSATADTSTNSADALLYSSLSNEAAVMG